jgi:hypothetical protein
LALILQEEYVDEPEPGKYGGRPTKNLKRELRITARFSKLEHYIIQEKAGKAGINVSEFLRQAAISVKVTAIEPEPME